MEFDVFFSISQTPVDGFMPDERQMFLNFFDQVHAADELGYGVAWIAESHYSTEAQKSHRQPVVPHWEGEVGLNVDFLQLAREVFHRTEKIETGSAVMNILCNGGPLAAAERIAAFLTYHGLDPEEKRRIHVGFAAGRFDFMNRTTGIDARDAIEQAAWPALKGKIFREAAQIFAKALRGDLFSAEDIPGTTLTRKDFRSDEDWARVLNAVAECRPDLGANPPEVPISRRFSFEATKIVPQEFRRDLLQLVIGSHEPAVQEMVNELLPVRVFNLSITPGAKIEDTHERMAERYHADGGPWKRSFMPRTVLVFLNDEPDLSPQRRREVAREEAGSALSHYWKALQGTIDTSKVDNAADNSLVGDVDAIAEQVCERFHPQDRLMLWFDFFNHDSDRVIRNMRAFAEKVIPQIEDRRRSS